jgi:putative tryptophan/tyrosine transport system substrate-binding protein
MNRKIFCLAVCAVLFALCPSAEAQQPKKIPRIGVLSPASLEASPLMKAFREGLHELGYVEGQNIAVEYRFTGGDPESLRSSPVN